VRSIFAAWERGDWSSADWADPDIDYVVADGPEPGTWSGLGPMAEAVRETLRAYKHLRMEADEFRELDDERVLVLEHFSGRGRVSGLELGQMRTHSVHVFHVRDSKVTKLVVYMDRDRALADLGLEGRHG
jgi:ketosteroid isomerase-like protein